MTPQRRERRASAVAAALFLLAVSPSSCLAFNSRRAVTQPTALRRHRSLGDAAVVAPAAAASSSALRVAAAGAAEGGDKPETGGTATIPNEVFNLVKSIVGAGVLSLPAGIAAFGDSTTALIPAAFLVAAIGAISGYTFQLIARVVAMTGATSYADAWDRTRGKATAWIIAWSSALDCFAGNISCEFRSSINPGRGIAGDFLLGSLYAVFGILTTSRILPPCLLYALVSPHPLLSRACPRQHDPG